MPHLPDHRLSIVVAARNRPASLRVSLPHHLALPERPEVIVVDDASTDDTAAVAAAHEGVRVMRVDESLGGAARNVGVEAARTPYVAFCDDDSWWQPGALRRAADLLDAHPTLAVVQGRILVGDDEREDAMMAEMAASALEPEGDQPGHVLLSFVACAVVVRRSAFLEAGGFTRRLAIGGEEELLGWDLAAAGWRMSYVPEVVAHHHPPRTAGRPERRELGIRNTLWTTWLRRPAGAAAARTVRDLGRFPNDRVTARGVARAVAGLPWVLRERRVSPPHVEAMRRCLEDQQLRSSSRRYVD